jgi:hypothetical protein
VPVAPGAAVSDSTPFTYTGTNPCNGEDFIGAGTLHTLMSENVSATGGLISHIDFSIDGLHAVTLGGKKYVVQDVLRDSLTFTGADEQTSDMTIHYVRQGDDGTLILGDDFYEYLRTHITVSASGVPSSHVDTNGAGVCQ